MYDLAFFSLYNQAIQHGITMKNKGKEIIASYGIVFGIILVIYILLGIYPFGEYTILKADLLQCYAPVFNDFREKLLSGRSILYSFNGSLGSHLFMNFETTLASPFNIIMLFFPRENLTEAAALLLLIKLPCAAASFCYFIKEKLPEKRLIPVIGSVSYALCAYVTALYWNIMWMDAVILLPFVALGLERLVKRGHGLCYSISLTAAMFINYGTAIFLCDFSVVYFILLLVAENKASDWKRIRKTVGSFLIRSLLAGGMAAVFLIPVFLSLQSTHYVEGQFNQPLQFYNSLPHFFVNQFWGMHPTALVFSDSVPNIYCGVLAVLLLPLFFLNSHIKRKEKAGYGIFLIILFLCFDNNLLTYLVHGRHFPAMMPHRYSFIWSFLLVVMAIKTLSELEGIQKKWIPLVTAGMLVLVLILAGIYPQKEVLRPARFSDTSLVVSIALILVYFLCWLLYEGYLPGKRKLRRTAACLLFVTVTTEAGSNAYIQFSHMNDGKRDAYIREFNGAMVPVSEELANETEFYRTEFKHYNTLSDGMLYDYKGVNAFAGYPAGTMRLMDSLGITASYNLLLLTNPTPLASAILNVKYLLNRRAGMQESFTTYRFKKQVDNVFVYENPDVLPLGFMVKEGILEWLPEERNNPFAFQNDYVHKAAGMPDTLFFDMGWSEYRTDKIYVEAAGENRYTYEIPGEVTAAMEPTITLCFNAPESRHTYIHVRTGGATYGNVKVNGSYVLKQAMRLPATALDAGFLEAGDRVEVELIMNQKTRDERKELVRRGEIQFYAAQMDMEVFKNLCTYLKEQPFKVDYYDNITVRGTVEAKEDGILYTSIPYDENWTVKIDDKRVQLTKIGGGLMGVRLFKGSHRLEFSYHERGLAAGGLISMASLFLLLAFEWMGRRKRKAVRATGEEAQTDGSRG